MQTILRKYRFMRLPTKTREQHPVIKEEGSSSRGWHAIFEGCRSFLIDSRRRLLYLGNHLGYLVGALEARSLRFRNGRGWIARMLPLSCLVSRICNFPINADARSYRSRDEEKKLWGCTQGLHADTSLAVSNRYSIEKAFNRL